MSFLLIAAGLYLTMKNTTEAKMNVGFRGSAPSDYYTNGMKQEATDGYDVDNSCTCYDLYGKATRGSVLTKQQFLDKYHAKDQAGLPSMMCDCGASPDEQKRNVTCISGTNPRLPSYMVSTQPFDFGFVIPEYCYYCGWGQFAISDAPNPGS